MVTTSLRGCSGFPYHFVFSFSALLLVGNTCLVKKSYLTSLLLLFIDVSCCDSDVFLLLCLLLLVVQFSNVSVVCCS